MSGSAARTGPTIFSIGGLALPSWATRVVFGGGAGGFFLRAAFDGHLSPSNYPSSKPPIGPEFLLRTSPPLRRNKWNLENSRMQKIKLQGAIGPLRGTDGSKPAPSSGESH